MKLRREIEGLPADVREVVEEIAGNKTVGSSFLARRSLEAYRKLVFHDFKSGEELTEAAERVNTIISSLRPSMPLIARFSSEVIRRLRQLNLHIGYGIDDMKAALLNVCSSVERDYDRVVDKLVKMCLEELGGLSSVLTVSFSGTVLKFLESVGSVERVVVLESRPMREGVELAKLLCEKKKVILYVDAAMAYALKEAEAVIIGADAVYRGVGFVGKIGSLPLCMLAAETKKPTYILVDSWKITEETKELNLEEGAETEILDEEYLGKIHARNPYFELVPNNYVSYYITDSGVVKDI